MAELSLYLTNVNVSLGQTMDTEKVKSFFNIISESPWNYILRFDIENGRGLSFYFLVRYSNDESSFITNIGPK